MIKRRKVIKEDVNIIGVSFSESGFWKSIACEMCGNGYNNRDDGCFNVVVHDDVKNYNMGVCDKCAEECAEELVEYHSGILSNLRIRIGKECCV